MKSHVTKRLDVNQEIENISYNNRFKMTFKFFTFEITKK